MEESIHPAEFIASHFLVKAIRQAYESAEREENLAQRHEFIKAADILRVSLKAEAKKVK